MSDTFDIDDFNIARVLKRIIIHEALRSLRLRSKTGGRIQNKQLFSIPKSRPGGATGQPMYTANTAACHGLNNCQGERQNQWPCRGARQCQSGRA
jgi:hypothetical protein